MLKSLFLIKKFIENWQFATENGDSQLLDDYMIFWVAVFVEMKLLNTIQKCRIVCLSQWLQVNEVRSALELKFHYLFLFFLFSFLNESDTFLIAKSISFKWHIFLNARQLISLLLIRCIVICQPTSIFNFIKMVLGKSIKREPFFTREWSVSVGTTQWFHYKIE